jgi:hypothetical protein
LCVAEEGSHHIGDKDAEVEEDDEEAAALRQMWDDFAKVATKLLNRIDKQDALPLLPVSAKA